MKKRTRSFNSAANSLVGIVCVCINIVVNFFARKIIIQYLGDEINGIHSLFQSFVLVLSVVETTMTTAMVVQLYAPIHNGDEEKINCLFTLYRKLYKIIALFFFAVSAVVCCFLPLFVKSAVPSFSVRIYFVLFSLSFVLGYAFYAPRCYLIAEQRNRISSLFTMLSEVIFRGIGLIFVIVYKAYALFLLMQIAEKVFGNLLSGVFLAKNRPFLRKRSKTELDGETKEKLAQTVRPLFAAQIFNAVQNASASLIMGATLGNIAIVGFYGNYQMISGALNSMFSQIGASFTSSFGDLCSENDSQKQIVVFRRFYFLVAAVSVVFSVGFSCCAQDFISFAFGTERTLPLSSVILISVGMFVSFVNVPAVSVQNATGTHGIDLKLMGIQAGLVVVLSLTGGMLWGLNGILIGSLIPLVVFSLLGKGIKVARQCLSMVPRQYLKIMGRGFVTFAVAEVAAQIAASFISTEHYLLSFLLKGALSVSICVLTVLAVYGGREESRYFVGVLKNILKKKATERNGSGKNVKE